MTKRKNIMPIFIPHQGCGHACIFCNQRHITGVDNDLDMDQQITEYLGYFKDPRDIELAFYGGSFTGLEEKEYISYLERVQPYLKKGLIKSIRLSTRPDYINKKILTNLARYGVETIELGVQSMRNSVLEANKRGTNREQIIRSSKLIKKSGFKLGLQMMTGLYGSSYKDDIYTAYEISLLDPDFVRIYPTMVLPKTSLYELYKEGLYEIMEEEEMFALLKELVIIFEGRSIDIIRIGLHNSGDGKEKNSIGPFHPATRQIVYASIYLDMLVETLQGQRKGQVKIYASSKNIDYLAGYKAANRRALNARGYQVSYKARNLAEGQVQIELADTLIKLDFNKYCSGKLEEKYEAQRN